MNRSRQILKATSIILFKSNTVLSAQDSLLNILDYYPLDNGNYWEYVKYSVDYPMPIYSYSYFSVEVTGDSMLQDKNYKILEYKNLPDNDKSWYTYERIDTSTGNVYRYDATFKPPANEYLLDSLFSDSGDTSRAARGWGWPECFENTYCLDILDDSILGLSTSIKYFIDCCAIPCIDYRLAKGLGYLGFDVCEFSCGGTSLLYARIRGIEYGEKVNKITRLDDQQVSKFYLHQNYPNPFNSMSVVKYNIPAASYIELSLFNLLGEKIMTLYQGMTSPGIHQVEIDGSGLSSGVYIYVLRGKNVLISRKCILLK